MEMPTCPRDAAYANATRGDAARGDAESAARAEGAAHAVDTADTAHAAHAADTYTADCHARIAFEVLANRWDSVVVYTLGACGPMRPRALVARIGGISPKVLNDALRRLEYNGLVERRTYAEAPPRVDYALTEAGTALLVPMRAMGAWAKRHADDVLTAQDRFEAQRRA